jgi:tetratricopeptide (TPR) repeat protein
LLTSGRSITLPRHQTLRAALDWSYDLLPAAERMLLCRLSVFAVNWTLEAAEAVCSGGQVFGCSGVQGEDQNSTNLNIRTPEHLTTLLPDEVLDLLTQLVDKSLVLAEGVEGEKRYRLLETVREYAAEQLSPEEQSTLARRHAGYYLALAEQAAPLLTGPELNVGKDRLEREQENLRAALAWAQSSGSGDIALRLGATLWRFWGLQGHLREGWDRLAEVLALPVAQAPTTARAEVLLGAGRINSSLGEAAAAMRLTTESLAVWRQVGDRRGIAEALNLLGDLDVDRSELDAAQERYEGALALYRELEDRSGIAETLYNLADVALREANVDTAEALLVECRQLGQELGDRALLAAALSDQGRVTLSRGDVARARLLFEEALTLRRALGVGQRIAWSLLDVAETARFQNDLVASRAAAAEALSICRQMDNGPGIGWALSELAGAVYSQGEIEAAAALYEESLSAAQQQGNTRGIALLLTSLGRVALRRGEIAAAQSRFAEALALHRKLGSLYGQAGALEGLAEVAAAREQLEQATRFLAAAARLWEQLPGRLPSLDQGSTELLLTRLRSSLGEEAFAALWEAGRACGEPPHAGAGE